MFGYSLEREQERSVLELLGFVATRQREISEAERQFIVDLSHDFNASADGIFEVSERQSLEEICRQFEDETAIRIALVYALRFAFIDGLYGEDEWLGVQMIGDAFGIPEEEVTELEDWTRRGLEWEEEGRALLGLPTKWNTE